ncbi:cytochrome P450 [Bradyrhizobium sp. F1.13.4]
MPKRRFRTPCVGNDTHHLAETPSTAPVITWHHASISPARPSFAILPRRSQRCACPVLWSRRDFLFVGDVWITTTHEATAQVLKDGADFTLRKEDGDVAGLRWWMPNYVRTIASNMLTMDEPDHTRLRSIVDEAFRRRAIVAMEPRIRAVADGLADELFLAGSPADLVQRYARILPLAVISELLGLPLADRSRFIAWANTMSSLTNVASFFRMLFAFRKMRAYLERQLQIARACGAARA